MESHITTEALRAAVIDHATALDAVDGDEMLCDFALVASWQSIVDDGSVRYTLHTLMDASSPHVVEGLLRVGLRQVWTPCEEED